MGVRNMTQNRLRFSRDQHESSVGQVFVANGLTYRLEGKAGDGAIGFVRKATQLGTLTPVAVKFLAPELKYIDESSLEDIHARFRREGFRGASLDHEDLVKILSYEENEDGSCFRDQNGPCNPFIVMEYIRGKTLESFIRGCEGQVPEVLYFPPRAFVSRRASSAPPVGPSQPVQPCRDTAARSPILHSARYTVPSRAASRRPGSERCAQPASDA
jgi:hypothetical protein